MVSIKDLDRSIGNSTTKTIPPIIHQTWKNKVIPDHWKESQAKWKKYHSGWAYVLWTDAMNRELIKNYYSWFLDKYDSYPYNIQRADAVRPFILHRYGGIYSDLDIAPNKSFAPLLSSSNGVILLNNNGRYTNMIMASNRDNPFWMEVAREMISPTIPWWSGTRHFYIQSTTGPYLIDRTARKYIGVISNFPPELVQPCSICDTKPCTKNNSYITMLEGSSWSRYDSAVITWTCCNYKWILAVVVSIIVVFMLAIYSF